MKIILIVIIISFGTLFELKTCFHFNKFIIHRVQQTSITIADYAKHPSIIPSSRVHTTHFSMDSSSSVSSSPNPQPSQRPSKAFIISPSTTQSGNDELLILQNFNQIQSGDRKKIGIIGSAQLSENHGQMIELLSYALVLSGNHVYTSGGEKGTNIAVIRGALRACNPDLLTVVLPQSLFNQPVEMQPLLMRVANLIEQPDKDTLDFKTAVAQCNEDILSRVDKVLVFAYHESRIILKSVESASDHLDVILFYLD